MCIQIGRWVMQPKIWRLVGFASTVIGLLCYALSSSFNHLFGEWNWLKIFLYSVFTFIICLAIVFAHVWRQHSTTLLFKAHLAVLVLTATTMYSFFYDKAVNEKPDAYSLISCAAFAIMSLSLSRQTYFGFEVDLLYFFLGSLIIQLMKINLLLAIVGAGFSYSLIILRSFLDAHSQPRNENLELQDHVVIQISPQQSDISTHGQSMSDESEQLNTQRHIGQDGDKLSLIKLASLIEVFAKKGTRDLKLQNKLMDGVDWLPDSLGKLSSLVTLDVSDNRIMALPSTIGGLSSLTRLDLHSNRITELPDSIGELISLVYLDLRGNQLSSLPASFGRLVHLEELDLSSNMLLVLPDSIGSLVSLKILNVKTNDIEEIPHSIGNCSSLRELRADYNRLKALPEAVGKIQSLEILSTKYNNIKQLPTTMASLINLKELDVSFNELESVPESLCFATSLVKMNIGNNFADMRSLPRSIGNLEMLEELDISNNQIRVLPDSFRMLTRLRILRVEENPLEVPPRHIAEKGAQAVVQYMAQLVEKRDVKSQPLKQKKSWASNIFGKQQIP